MKHSLIAVAAGALAILGVASAQAGQGVLLTSDQLDNVTAGNTPKNCNGHCGTSVALALAEASAYGKNASTATYAATATAPCVSQSVSAAASCSGSGCAPH